MSNDFLNYADKAVLIVGGATGMGAAAAALAGEQGARVHVIDVAEVSYPVAQSLKVDLRRREQIDAAVAALPSRIDVVFSCAGVADGFPNLMLINFIGQRYLLEQLTATGRLQRGAAIVAISSVAGLSWLRNRDQVTDFLKCPDWDSAAAWIAAHEGTDSYGFSKEAWNTYVSREALSYLRRGIRINAALPGPTDTPLARANADVWLGFGTDFRKEAGIQPLTPRQIANTLLFLGSDAASGVNGVVLLVDSGHANASMTDAWNEPYIDMMLGLT